MVTRRNGDPWSNPLLLLSLGTFLLVLSYWGFYTRTSNLYNIPLAILGVVLVYLAVRGFSGSAKKSKSRARSKRR